MVESALENVKRTVERRRNNTKKGKTTEGARGYQYSKCSVQEEINELAQIKNMSDKASTRVMNSGNVNIRCRKEDTFVMNCQENSEKKQIEGSLESTKESNMIFQLMIQNSHSSDGGSEVTKTRVINYYNFIPVEYNGVEGYEKELYYGGNQSWFYDKKKNNSFDDRIIEDGGCGAIASTDLIIYLSQYRSKTKKVMPFTLTKDKKFSIPYMSYSDYTELTRKLVNEYIKPNTYHVFNNKGTFGYLPFQLKYMIKEYLKNNDINIKVNNETILFMKKNSLLNKIKKQLKSDIPVPIMVGGGNTTMYRVDPHTNKPILGDDDEQSSASLQYHWVNIVGVVEDKSEGTITLELSSWGKKYQVNFNKIYENSGVLDSILLIE